MPARLARLAILLLLTIPIGAEDPKPALAFSRKIGVEQGPGRWMNFVAMSPDGGAVASNGGIPGKSAGGLGLWTFPEGKFIRSIASRPLALSADWRFLAADGAIFDFQSGRPLAQLATKYGRFGKAAFSPDGQYLAFAVYRGDQKGGAGRIVALKTADGSLVREFGMRYTSAMAVLPDNRTLASGHWDNVTLWDLPTGRRIALLAGFGRYVYGIGVSKDGRFLAAGTDDGQLQIWDVAARKCVHSLRIGYSDVSDPAFSPDGKLVAAGTYAEGAVTLVDVSSGAILSQTKISMFGCGSVAFSPDGKYLIAPSNGGQIGPRQFDTGGTMRVFVVTSQ